MTRDDLIAAICASPHDEALRLVYADHLLESGELLDRQRGELIIAQCILAREPCGSDAWRGIEKRLLEEVRGRPVARVGDFDSWKRGFPTRVRVRIDKLMKYAEELRRQPLEIVQLANHPAAPITIGTLARARDAFPNVLAFTVEGGDGHAQLRTSLLPALDPDDGTLAWPDHDVPHPVLRGAVVELALRPNPELESIRLDHYFDLPLPALEALALSSEASHSAVEIVGRRKLRSLAFHSSFDRNVGATFARAGVFDSLETLDAKFPVLPEAAAAIEASSITDLSLEDLSRDALIKLAPRLRRLRLTSAYKEPISTFAGIPFPALEWLSLSGYRFDAKTAELDMPKLGDLELFSCELDAAATEILSGRGLLYAGSAR